MILYRVNSAILHTFLQIINQKAALSQSNLQRADLLKNVTVGAIVLVKNNKIITEKNGLLQNLVREKEWLLKEVQHRVKNNLHTLLCLLESQASHLKNEGLAAVEVSQHRIYAMSLIHQKLYQAEDIRTVLIDKYIAEFVDYLGDSFEGRSEVHFMLDIEPIRLAVSQAIPLALIINEAVTNSMKYAFPDKRPGHYHY
jgi:two-component sensor histidine kinase